MTDTEKIRELERYYRLLQTDETKLLLFRDLKAKGDKVSMTVLRTLVDKWLVEK